MAKVKKDTKKSRKTCTKIAKASKKCTKPIPEKKPLMVGPRLRLEPRLTPTPISSPIPIVTPTSTYTPSKRNPDQDLKDSLLNLIQKVNANSLRSSSLFTTSPMEISSNYEQENNSSTDSECSDSGERYGKENASVKSRLFYTSSSNKGFDEEECKNTENLCEYAQSPICNLDEEISWFENSTAEQRKKNPVSKSNGKNPSSTVEENIVEDGQPGKEKRRVRTGNTGNICYWNDRELKDLAIALQNRGFANLKEIADCVKTKNENDIRAFLRTRTADAYTLMREKTDGPRQRGRPRSWWNAVIPENLKKWPNIRKWRRAAYEQMMFYTRVKDYSKPSIIDLCKQFHDEEEEPSDPEVMNVKLIYKYMMNCMAGQVPPQLPPKESALLLDLLREVRLMPIAYDFEEERKFLNEFKSATIFKPFELKDEFKKRFRHAPDPGPNAVLVPEQVYMELSRHRRVLQSFSPLVTPVWMIQKGQEIFKQYLEDEAVYVD